MDARLVVLGLGAAWPVPALASQAPDVPIAASQPAADPDIDQKIAAGDFAALYHQAQQSLAKSDASSTEKARSRILFAIAASELGLLEESEKALAETLKDPAADQQAYADLLPEFYLAQALNSVAPVYQATFIDDEKEKKAKLESSVAAAQGLFDRAIAAFRAAHRANSILAIEARTKREWIMVFANRDLALANLGKLEKQLEAELGKEDPRLVLVADARIDGGFSVDPAAGVVQLDRAIRIAETSLPRHPVIADLHATGASGLADKQFPLALKHKLAEIDYYKSTAIPQLVATGYDSLGWLFEENMKEGVEDYIPAWLEASRKAYGPVSAGYLQSLKTAQWATKTAESDLLLRDELLRKIIEVAEKLPDAESDLTDALGWLIEVREKRVDELREGGRVNEAQTLEGETQKLSARLAQIDQRKLDQSPAAETLKAKAESLRGQFDYAGAADAYEKLFETYDPVATSNSERATTAAQLASLYGQFLYDKQPDALDKALRFANVVLDDKGAHEKLGTQRVIGMQFLRAAIFARKGQTVDADRQLGEAVAAWAADTKDLPPDLLTKDNLSMYGVSDVVYLADEKLQPSTIRNFAAVLDRLSRRSPVLPFALNKVMRELRASRVEPGSPSEFASLMLEVTRTSPDDSFRVLSGALRLVPEEAHGALLDTFERQVSQRGSPPPLVAGIEVARLQLIPDPRDRKDDGEVDTGIWSELAEAQIASGDLMAARKTLKDAPDKERSAIAAAIAAASGSEADARAALAIAQGEDGDHRLWRARELTEAARKTPQLGDWRFYARAAGEENQWRFAGEYLSSGEPHAAIAALQSVDEADRARGIGWAADEVAKMPGPREEPYRLLMKLANDLRNSDKSSDAFRNIAEAAHERDPSLAREAAERGLGKLKVIQQKDCDGTASCLVANVTSFGWLFGGWGDIAQVRALAAMLPEAERADFLIDGAVAAKGVAPREEVHALLDEARKQALKTSDLLQAKMDLDRAGEKLAENGYLDEALQAGKSSNAVNPLSLSSREQSDLETEIKLLALGGAPERAEPLVEKVSSNFFRAIAAARVAAGWARLGNFQRLASAFDRTQSLIAALPQGDRDRPREVLREELAERLAADGHPEALAYAEKLKLTPRELGRVIRELPPAAVPASIIETASAKSAVGFKPTKEGERNDELVSLAQSLSKAGWKNAANRVLASVDVASLPHLGAKKSVVSERAELVAEPLLARLDKLAPVLSPALAGDLAREVQPEARRLGAHKPEFERRVLAVAQHLVDRGIGASINLDAENAGKAIREELAALDGRKIDFNQEAMDRLATIPAKAAAENKSPFFPYVELAMEAAFKEETLPAALEAARLGTRTHQDDLFRELAKGKKSLASMEGEIRNWSADHFLHFALLARKIAQNPDQDRETLLEEAFSVTQFMSFDALTAEQLIDRAAPSRNEGLRALMERFASVRRAIQEGSNLDPSSGSEVVPLARELSRKIKAIYATAPATLTQSRPTLRQVQARLTVNQALILFVSASSSRSALIAGKTVEPYLFVVRHDRAEIVPLDTAASLIERDAKTLIEGLGSMARNARSGISVGKASKTSVAASFDTVGSYHLYRNLLAPAAPALDGVSDLLILPRSALAALPLQLLVTELPDPVDTPLDKVAWLARKFAISYVPNLADLSRSAAQRSSATARKPFIGFGDPVMSRVTGSRGATDSSVLDELGRPDVSMLAALEPLSETADELRLTAAAFAKSSPADRNCRVCLAEEATEEHLRSLSASGELARFRVLSFATHGLVAGQIDGLAESALVLTPGDIRTTQDDGLLTASEAAQLELSADLVLLTACNTGVGESGSDEAGLSSLANAFLYAGARSVMVSHWPVDSKATAHLAASAAENFATNAKAGFSFALRKTMLDMIDGKIDPRWSHPFYWSAFTLVEADASH